MNSDDTKEGPMSPQVSDLMAQDVATVDPHASLREAARVMRDHDIGDVVIADGTKPAGIIIDRDIAIRGVAEACDPETTEVGGWQARTCRRSSRAIASRTLSR
jgi:CBS domain-containing protein